MGQQFDLFAPREARPESKQAASVPAAPAPTLGAAEASAGGAARAPHQLLLAMRSVLAQLSDAMRAGHPLEEQLRLQSEADALRAAHVEAFVALPHKAAISAELVLAGMPLTMADAYDDLRRARLVRGVSC